MTITQAPQQTRWADDLPPALRRQVDWVVSAAANALFGAASEARVYAREPDVPKALALGHALMDTHAEMLDLHDDLAAAALADALAVPCTRPGCTHGRGSHLEGTGACGYCGCPGFVGEQVTFAELDAKRGAAA